MNVTFVLRVQISAEWRPFDREPDRGSEGLVVSGEGEYSQGTERRWEICRLAAVSDRRYKGEQLLLRVLIRVDEICCWCELGLQAVATSQRRTLVYSGTSGRSHRHIGWILKVFKTSLIMLLKV